MSDIGQLERITQNRVIQLFREQLGYEYLGSREDFEDNGNIEEPMLRAFLSVKQGYTEQLVSKALYELYKAAGDQNKSLYDLNKDVYSMLRYGIKIRPEAGASTETVHLVDWQHPFNNHFAIAEEVTVKGEHHKRPDVVLYLNGIAIGVLELKRSTVSVSEGIRQNLDNQKQVFIKQFFATVQLVMAGNDTEGLRYGTIETPEKYYLTWKENLPVENLLDKHLLLLCSKTRILEIIHDFMVFDRGQKKLCRHNQYFGVLAAREHIRRREGGIIWHTQGSGKSLTMVWLTKWIRENIRDSRVLIITDRDELDKQIEKVYKGISEDIYRSRSCRDLIEKLNASNPWLLCSLIHKFGNREEADYEGYIQELRQNLPPGFEAKGDIYVFVDECHRTQSGKLHEAMKQILPNAIFIGFTGTPLLKRDKQTSMEVFGKFIHTYKFDEAVADKVILDLRYEARNIEQDITSQAKIDQWFEAKTKGLTEYARTELKKRWGTMQKVLSSQSRLEKIVADILLDMETRERLQNGHGNALLISGSIYQACKFYELFQKAGFTQCAIVTSYVPEVAHIKGEETGSGVTERLLEYGVYQKMLDGKDPEIFEDEAKKKFIEEPAQMKLLIVVDKLLTGFDAPPATFLYIDKKMQDHGLFQAICRVNRLDGDDKEYGYVIDYKDLFKSLEKAVDEYTSGAFDGYEKEDVDGLLSDRLKKGRERLEECLETLRILCDPVEPPKNTQSFSRYFCGNPENKDDLKDTEQKRLTLYKQVVALIRAYAGIANEMLEAGYTTEDIARIKKEVEFFENLRQEIKLASGDYINLKAYEPAMRHLIDTYIGAKDSEVISAFDDLTLIDLIVQRGIEEASDSLPKSIRENKEAMAETIENNIRRLIIDEMPTNPKYFEKMSVLLDELIKERKKEAKDYALYLKKIAELTRMIRKPEESGRYPKTLNTKAKRALYDNLGKDEMMAVQIDAEILFTRKDGWRGNKIKEREVRNAIRKFIPDETRLDQIFELVKNQVEY